MSEDLNPPSNLPSPPGSRMTTANAGSERERRRNALLRQLGALLAAAVAAFALTTWALVRMDGFARQAGDDAGPSRVVRAQLTALDRGELREAYDLFSQKYRDRVPFRAFHELVAAHPAMFRARRVEFASREESRARAVLDTHIVAADGERYVARYTLIVVEGHWWIDDLRWGREAELRGRATARFDEPPRCDFAPFHVRTPLCATAVALAFRTNFD